MAYSARKDWTEEQRLEFLELTWELKAETIPAETLERQRVVQETYDLFHAVQERYPHLNVQMWVWNSLTNGKTYGSVHITGAPGDWWEQESFAVYSLNGLEVDITRARRLASIMGAAF